MAMTPQLINLLGQLSAEAKFEGVPVDQLMAYINLQMGVPAQVAPTSQPNPENGLVTITALDEFSQQLIDAGHKDVVDAYRIAPGALYACPGGLALIQDKSSKAWWTVYLAISQATFARNMNIAGGFNEYVYPLVDKGVPFLGVPACWGFGNDPIPNAHPLTTAFPTIDSVVAQLKSVALQMIKDQGKPVPQGVDFSPSIP